MNARDILLILLFGMLVVFTASFFFGDNFNEGDVDTGTGIMVDTDNGISSIEVDEDFGDDEDGVRLIACVKDNYMFKGWYDARNKLVETSPALYVQKTHTTVYARTVLKPVAVVDLSSDSGISGVEGSGQYDRGSDVTITADLRDGYKFTGWYDGDRLFSTSLTVTLKADDLNLKACTSSDLKANMNVVKDDGIYGYQKEGGEHLGDEVVFKAYPEPGWYLKGWYDKDGNQLSNCDELRMEADNMTIYLRATNERPVELQLHKDAGVEGVTGSGFYSPGTVTSISVQLRDGYTFDGWYDIKDNLLSEDLDFEFENVSHDSRLYARSSPEYTINLIGGMGNSDGTYSGDEFVEFRAQAVNDMVFDGWYTLDGYLLSTNQYLVPERENMTIVCKMSYPDTVFPNKLEYGPFPDWYDDGCYTTVTDYISGGCINMFKGDDADPMQVPAGRYVIDYTNGLGGMSEKTETVTVEFDGEVTQTFEWKYNGQDYEMRIQMDYGRFVDYENMDVNRWPVPTKVVDFVNYDKDFTRTIGEELSKYMGGMNEVDKANFLLKFVQMSTYYEKDDVSHGEEYYKYSFETLMTHRGDCEDTAILYMALMKYFGLDVVALYFEDHVAVGANVPADGKYFVCNGKNYFTCETTSDTNVGEWPWTGKYSNPMFVPIP